MTDQSIQTIHWDFPGSWTGLVLAFLFLAAFTILSYRYSLRDFGGFRKTVLCLLRILLFCLILLCLTNPRMETERTIRRQEKPKIAVVFDESGSMLKPSVWKRNRFQDAVAFWNEKVNRADVQTDFYHFGRNLRTVPGAGAEPDVANSGETRFYALAREWIPRFEAEKYNGVICFTDGIDTGEEGRGDLLSALAATPLEHVFVAMNQEVASMPELSFRKIESPSQVFTKTENALTFLIRCGNLHAGFNPVFELLRNRTEVLYTQELAPVNGIRTVKYRMAAELPGTELLTARLLLKGKVCESVTWSIEKTERKDKLNVLIFNGSLDFGTRFIRNVFLDEPSIALDIRYAKGIFPEKTGKGVEFPNRDELGKFDILLLMNLKRNALGPNAEADAMDFVQKGGGLLFVCGNPAAAREYAASTLETLLPVKFARGETSDSRAEPETQRILDEIARGRTPTQFDAHMVRQKEFTFKPQPLYPFELTLLGKKSPLFYKNASDGKPMAVIPQFQDMAPVDSLKPGANLLAFHTAGGREHPLLAYQNFGTGRSMVLACDPLWRWKLNLPSKNPAYEIFWKNLFSYLSLGKNRTTRWIVPNLTPDAKEWELALDPGALIPDPGRIVCKLESGGTEQTLPLQTLDGKLRCVVKPDGTEKTIRAFYEGKAMASFTFSALKSTEIAKEFRTLEPDMEGLREFATLPNVTLLDSGSKLDLADRFGRKEIILKEKTIHPLWHNGWMFFWMAALLILEWIARRWNRLL